MPSEIEAFIKQLEIEVINDYKKAGYTDEDIKLINKLHPIQRCAAHLDPVNFKKYLIESKDYLTSLADDDWKRYESRGT